jgi:hypothetical protein
LAEHIDASGWIIGVFTAFHPTDVFVVLGISIPGIDLDVDPDLLFKRQQQSHQIRMDIGCHAGHGHALHSFAAHCIHEY